MWTIASDIDGTLTGDRESLDRLAERLRKLRSEGQLCLVLSTGRRLSQVLSGVAEEGLPEPDAVLCQVGTEIYLPPLAERSEPLAAWRELLLRQYDRDEAESFLAGIAGLEMQPAKFNTQLKTSCYLDSCPDPEAAAAEIERRVEPHADRYQVVWSSSRDLDILPASAGKGKAIRFLVRHLELDAERVVVAGDTGNDATMFAEFAHGIIVANAQPELVQLAETLGCGRSPDRATFGAGSGDPRTTGVYHARQSYAGGVEEGLVHFGVLD